MLTRKMKRRIYAKYDFVWKIQDKNRQQVVVMEVLDTKLMQRRRNDATYEQQSGATTSALELPAFVVKFKHIRRDDMTPQSMRAVAEAFSRQGQTMLTLETTTQEDVEALYRILQANHSRLSPRFVSEQEKDWPKGRRGFFTDYAISGGTLRPRSNI